MKLELIIPTNLSEIPLKAYQKFIKLSEENTDEDFLAQKMIEVLCGIELKQVVKIQQKYTDEIVSKLYKVFEQKPDFKPRFFIQEREFGFIPDLENISIGEFADLQNNINSIDTFHKAMAVLYRPITRESLGKYEIESYEGSATYSEVMEFMPLDVTLGAMLFFCDLIKDLSKGLAVFLEMETKKLMNLAKGHNLQSDGAGTLHSINLLKETLPSLMKFQGFQLPVLSRY